MAPVYVSQTDFRKPATPTDPFIVDILNEAATSFAQKWVTQQGALLVEQEDAEAIISVLVGVSYGRGQSRIAMELSFRKKGDLLRFNTSRGSYQGPAGLLLG